MTSNVKYLAPHSRPRKDKDIHDPPPPLVQCALYGTEMLCSSPGVSHAINLVVVGMRFISSIIRNPF